MILISVKILVFLFLLIIINKSVAFAIHNKVLHTKRIPSISIVIFKSS